MSVIVPVLALIGGATVTVLALFGAGALCVAIRLARSFD